MLHGSNVLCEKPASGNPRDIQEMIDVPTKQANFWLSDLTGHLLQLYSN